MALRQPNGPSGIHDVAPPGKEPSLENGKGVARAGGPNPRVQALVTSVAARRTAPDRDWPDLSASTRYCEMTLGALL